MSDVLSPSDRLEFANLIKSAHRCYQQLYEAAALASISNTYSRSVTLTRSRSQVQSSAGLTSPTLSLITVKAEEYHNTMKVSNMHIDIHYAAIMKKNMGSVVLLMFLLKKTSIGKKSASSSNKLR